MRALRAPDVSGSRLQRRVDLSSGGDKSKTCSRVIVACQLLALLFLLCVCAGQGQEIQLNLDELFLGLPGGGGKGCRAAVHQSRRRPSMSIVCSCLALAALHLPDLISKFQMLCLLPHFLPWTRPRPVFGDEPVMTKVRAIRHGTRYLCRYEHKDNQDSTRLLRRRHAPSMPQWRCRPRRRRRPPSCNCKVNKSWAQMCALAVHER